MELGTGRNEVKLSEHSSEWAEEFKRVEKELTDRTALLKDQIEHIGSTAIKEIKAKPIIDILVGIESINKDTSSLEKELQTCGFYRLKVERSNEIVYAKFTDETFEVRTHYLHLTDLNSDLWHNLIYFRNYLNSHKTARKEYEKIKQEFVNENSEGVKEYTDMKESFVNKILSYRESNH